MKALAVIVTIFAMVSQMAGADITKQASPGAQELKEKFYKSLGTCQGYVKNYTWDTRTDVIRGDKVMEILIERNWYLPDGNVQRSIINKQDTKLPTSFLIHRMAEEMKARMIAFMDKLHVFLNEYRFSDREKSVVFFSKAMIFPPDAEGLILVSAKDVLVTNDRVQWWIDSRTFYLAKFSITTYFEGNKVDFNAAYEHMPPGLNYLNFAEISVPSKNTTILVHCYDYAKIK